jgi:hypothetical protein
MVVSEVQNGLDGPDTLCAAVHQLLHPLAIVADTGDKNLGSASHITYADQA